MSVILESRRAKAESTHSVYAALELASWWLHLRAPAELLPIFAHFQLFRRTKGINEPVSAISLPVAHTLEGSDRGERDPVLRVGSVESPHKSNVR